MSPKKILFNFQKYFLSRRQERGRVALLGMLIKKFYSRRHMFQPDNCCCIGTFNEILDLFFKLPFHMVEETGARVYLTALNF